jgi:hypothetical protein
MLQSRYISHNKAVTSLHALNTAGIDNVATFNSNLLQGVQQGANGQQNILVIMRNLFHLNALAARTAANDAATIVLNQLNQVESTLEDKDSTCTTELANLRTQLTNSDSNIANLNMQYTTLNTQVQQIPVSTQTGSSQRQPKMSKLPEFLGKPNSKVKFGE